MGPTERTSAVPRIPCDSLRRSDGQPGHLHWLRKENANVPPCPQFLYHGGCACRNIKFQFQTRQAIDENAIFYTCDCQNCFKRGYIFFVVPLKHFIFKSKSVSDLGTFATATGTDLLLFRRNAYFARKLPSLFLSSLWCSVMGGV